MRNVQWDERDLDLEHTFDLVAALLKHFIAVYLEVSNAGTESIDQIHTLRAQYELATD